MAVNRKAKFSLDDSAILKESQARKNKALFSI